MKRKDRLEAEAAAEEKDFRMNPRKMKTILHILGNDQSASASPNYPVKQIRGCEKKALIKYRLHRIVISCFINLFIQCDWKYR